MRAADRRVLLWGVVGLACMLGQASLVRVQAASSGSVQLEGVVEGQAPSQPAVISVPKNNSRVSVSAITNEGSCQSESLLKTYSGSRFIGSVICSQSGSFSLKTSLQLGANALVIRSFNMADQEGPASAPVTVFYDLPVSSSPVPTSKPSAGATPALPSASPPVQASMLAISAPALTAVSSDSVAMLVFEVTGGSPPYAVHIDWGDGSTELLSKTGQGASTLRHTYEKAGTYTVGITAVDPAKGYAFMQVLAIVNGETGEGTPTPKGSEQRGFLDGDVVRTIVLILILALIAGIVRQFFKRGRYLV